MSLMTYDVIVAGGGVAGACAALHLSRSRRVLLLDACREGSEASGPAAGLVNPLMAQRARPVWRMEEALDALHATLDIAGAAELFRAGGVLRPAADVAQAAHFRQAAEAHPSHGEWVASEESEERYPAVRAPFGALLVRTGGALPFQELIRRLTAAAVRNGAEVRKGAVVTGFEEADASGWVEVESEARAERVHGKYVVLALGGGWAGHPELRELGLHSVKGQTVEVRPAGGLDLSGVPHLAGTGYVVSGGATLVLGSSYEHVFSDLRPSPERTAEIVAKVAHMLPLVSGAEVVAEWAGVRVTVPGARLPMVGPLPNRKRVWVLTGLGSKGLLMAPLLARELAGYLENPERIPAEIRVRSKA